MIQSLRRVKRERYSLMHDRIVLVYNCQSMSSHILIEYGSWHIDPIHSGSMMEMKKDQISLVPYNIIEQLLARGEVELV